MVKHKGIVMAIINQKGGTGKTFTAQHLSIGLANAGNKVLLVDFDPQGSLTVGLGFPDPDGFETTISEIMTKVINEEMVDSEYGVIHQREGVDLIPSNIKLSGLEVSLVNVMSRETVLRRYLEIMKPLYDYILIDCGPSLGMLTINALTAASSILIPVQTQYLSVKGLDILLGTVARVRRNLNPSLAIAGILLTMVDGRTKNAREMSALIREAYGEHIKVFETEIPRSVRAAEVSTVGTSIFEYEPTNPVAVAYSNLIKEVIDDA